jgi:hypothetical protein
MIGVPDLSEMDERVNSSEKGAVEPTTTLGDEFRDGV